MNEDHRATAREETVVLRSSAPDTQSGPTKVETPPRRADSGDFAEADSHHRLTTPGAEHAGQPERGPAFAPRTRVAHYELIRKLGAGGMATVFLARDTKLGRRVAIKFVSTPSPALSERFVAEARTTALCNHENIVVIHDVGVHEHIPYMVLEYLEGQTLTQVIRTQKLSAPRAVELVVPVLRALQRAHESGIAHRDLKPDNIFVTATGQVKVLDFGIAKLLSEVSPRAPTVGSVLAGHRTQQTMAGTLVGTPAFMSPEQFGTDEVDHRTDLWAVGVILFRMVTGRHPAEDPTDLRQLELLANCLDEPVPTVRSLNRSVPLALAEAIDRCLAKRKRDRWGSAEELLAVLEPLLPGRLHRKLGEDDSPYPGLQTFQERDANRFFGRDHEVARAIARLREHPLLAVVGPSGVGKSSFVRAGVVPALKASERWDVITIRPGRDPLGALAGIVVRTGSEEMTATVRKRLVDEPGLLAVNLRARARERQERVLLFVDQFEELYTLGADERERAAFVACLGGVADDARSRLRVVLSMRTDLLDRLSEHGELAHTVMQGISLLATPAEQALREALELPLGLAGYAFEGPEIVDDMLRGLGTGTGALPLLQFVADALWNARDRERKLLTRAAYAELGGVAGAFATHADHVVTVLPDASQRFVRAVFERLVTPERTRAIVDLHDLVTLAETEAEGQRLIDYLVGERLLVMQRPEGGGSTTVEVVHESLITSWPMLRRWLDEDQDEAAFVAQLQTAARQWDERGRPDGLLWTGEPAREAQRWLERGGRALAARERAFLESVVRLATRAQRRRRSMAMAAFVALAAVAIGAIVAVFLVRQAEQAAQAQALAAQRETERAHQAETQASDARREVEAQLRFVQEKEEQRRLAEAKATEASAQVTLSQEELRIANGRLQRALETAEQAAAKERAASQHLEKLLAEERERFRKLKKRQEEIATDLK